MDFYKTTMGKRFFEQQLPNLITALKDIAASLKNPPPVFRLEQEATPDFLTDLYYGRHDPLEPANPQVFHKFNADIIAHQDQMRKLLTPEAWDIVEQYKALLDARGTVGREQAFATGFRYATKLFAAGLSVPRSEETSN